MSLLRIKHNAIQNILFTLLLTSGTLKPFLNIFIIKFDLTLAMLIIVLIDMMFSFGKGIKLNQNKIIFILIILSFYFLMLISLIYSKSDRYGYIKSASFLINLIYFIYPLFLKQIDFKIILKVITYIILPLSIWFIIYRYLYWTPEFEYVRLSKQGFYHITHLYLGLGMFLALGMLITYYTKYSMKLFFVLLICLVAIGARASLIFSVFIILSSKLIQLWNFIKTNPIIRLSSRSVFLFFIIIFGSLALYINGVLESSFFKYGLIRLKSLFNVGNDESSLGRLDRMSFAIEHVFDSPISFLFGHGVGSFGVMYLNKDLREYPHNIFLESWFELGVLGLILILIFSFVPYFLKHNKIYKVLALFIFINALKSGSLTDLWIFFAFYGVLIFNPKILISNFKS